MEMSSDRQLMTQIRQRDERAFEQLVQRYGARLLTLARRTLGSHADAEDAVQRAFLRCYTGAAAYRPEWAVSTWLYRILTNICVDELRRRAVRTPRDPRTLRAGLEPRAPAPPAEHLDLARALVGVPREARILLGLRYVDGLSYHEMARIRGISINTVKSQLARGKSLLRAVLRKGGRE